MNKTATLHSEGGTIEHKAIKPIEVVPVAEFVERMKAQGVPVENVAFICPMCQTIQTGLDLIEAGAGKDMDEVDRYLGFVCVGRFLGAGETRAEPDGSPCNWTLGGLLRVHKIEIKYPDDIHKQRAIFDLATPEQAKEHLRKRTLAKAKK